MKRVVVVADLDDAFNRLGAPSSGRGRNSKGTRGVDDEIDASATHVPTRVCQVFKLLLQRDTDRQRLCLVKLDHMS